MISNRPDSRREPTAQQESVSPYPCACAIGSERGCGYARLHIVTVESMIRGPDGRQKVVIHTDQVLSSGFSGTTVKATLDERPCAA